MLRERNRVLRRDQAELRTRPRTRSPPCRPRERERKEPRAALKRGAGAGGDGAGGAWGRHRRDRRRRGRRCGSASARPGRGRPGREGAAGGAGSRQGRLPTPPSCWARHRRPGPSPGERSPGAGSTRGLQPEPRQAGMPRSSEAVAVGATRWRRPVGANRRSWARRLRRARKRSCRRCNRIRRRAMRVLALDYGSARCGCALSDPTGTIVSPIQAIARPAGRRGLAAIEALIRERDVERVVVGLPCRCTEAIRIRRARPATSRGACRCAWARGSPVELHDERFTTASPAGSGLEPCRGGFPCGRPHARELAARAEPNQPDRLPALAASYVCR